MSGNASRQPVGDRVSTPRPPRVRRVSPRNAAAPRTCAATIAMRSTPGRPRTNPGTSHASCAAPTCVAPTATVTGRSGLTSLTINPVPAGRGSTDDVTGITRAGTGDAGTGVDAGATAAVANGEGAGVGRGTVVSGRGVAVAIGSDAVGSGELVTVGSDADGNGDRVATGSEAEGSGRIVAIGSDAEGSGRIVAIGSETEGSGRIVAIGSDADGRGGSVITGSDGRGGSVTPGNTGASVGSSGRFGPAAAADGPNRTNPPITTNVAKAFATAPRPARGALIRPRPGLVPARAHAHPCGLDPERGHRAAGHRQPSTCRGRTS